ncbi:MAG: hypothetical protein IT258_23070 [Saprospiraceae bacterium]|nr:hypothetical protein [Saprospiraceae bacterium]
MQTLHLIKVQLDIPLRRFQISRLRGMVAEHAGFEHDLLHNHRDGKADKYHYRYPLVQYKVQNGKALVVGINKGAEILRSIFQPMQMTLANDLPVASWKETFLPVGMSEELRPYSIWQWLPLNQENYQRWLENDNQFWRHEELERILTAHLLAFAEGIQFTVPRPRGLFVQIDEITAQRAAKFHDNDVLSFDVKFQANMLLPADVGIGRGSSHGFGSLVGIRSSAFQRKENPSVNTSDDTDMAIL